MSDWCSASLVARPASECHSLCSVRSGRWWPWDVDGFDVELARWYHPCVNAFGRALPANTRMFNKRLGKKL